MESGTGELVVRLTGLGGKAGLYVRHAEKPTLAAADCTHVEPTADPSSRRFVIAAPAAGRWWIGVNNDEESTSVSYSVRASWTAPADFYTMTPCRLLDTRRPGQQPLASGVARVFQAAGSCGLPATAQALSANVTVVGPTGAGHVILHPGDAPAPATSTINFGPGQTRANNAILSLDRGGLGTFGAVGHVQGAGQVHLIVDVNGYFQ